MSYYDPITFVRDAVRRLDGALRLADKWLEHEEAKKKRVDVLEEAQGVLIEIKDQNLDDNGFVEDDCVIASTDLNRLEEIVMQLLDGEQTAEPKAIVKELVECSAEIRTWLHDAELEYDRQRSR